MLKQQGLSLMLRLAFASSAKTRVRFLGERAPKSRGPRSDKGLCPDCARIDLFQQIRVVFERRAHSPICCER
jgi:hypothetical protein